MDIPCYFCGLLLDRPGFCELCQQMYCSQHDSPEAHQCPKKQDKSRDGLMRKYPFKETKLIVIGPAGSGKTTLLRNLMGLSTPDDLPPTCSVDTYRTYRETDTAEWEFCYNLDVHRPARVCVVFRDNPISALLSQWPETETQIQYLTRLRKANSDLHLWMYPHIRKWPEYRELELQRMNNRNLPVDKWVSKTRPYETEGDELIGNTEYVELMKVEWPTAQLHWCRIETSQHGKAIR